MSVTPVPLEIPWLILGVFQLRRFLHIFQLEEYDNSRFLRWSLRNGVRRAGIPALALIAIPVAIAAMAIDDDRSGWIGIGIWVLAPLVAIVLELVRPLGQKRPLVFTPRAVRLMTAAMAVEVAVLLGVWLVSRNVDGRTTIVIAFGALFVACAPLYLVIANGMMFPVESSLRRSFIARATHTVRGMSDLRVIGVTGSYGKTSTKDFITSMLRDLGPVVSTPASFNTVLGITKAINEGLLARRPRRLVAELGAYREGEIRRLCELLRPQVGVLTAVGPQHLERFGSIAAIASAKYELIQALPPDGCALLNADDPICRELGRKTTHVEVVYYGTEATGVDLFLRADEIHVGTDGTTFTLTVATGRSAECRTGLLGKHNIQNVLAAVAVSLREGLGFDQAIAAIARLRPTAHRLEPRKVDGGLTLIDDSYNSNPIGAEQALETLRRFPQQRLLITPGLVELGPEEAKANEHLGMVAARACDAVVLVGDRSKWLRAGLTSAGFDAAKIHEVRKLGDALALLRRLARPGDTVLLLNDLPDTYEVA